MVDHSNLGSFIIGEGDIINIPFSESAKKYKVIRREFTCLNNSYNNDISMDVLVHPMWTPEK